MSFCFPVISPLYNINTGSFQLNQFNAKEYTWLNLSKNTITKSISRNKNNGQRKTRQYKKQLNKYKISSSSSPRESIGFFPAGQKQGTITLPALFVTITVSQVLNDDMMTNLSKALSGGVNAVILTDIDNNKAVNAGELYNAAKKLKELVRERAALYIIDRPDIADAVSAEGVLLTPGSVPVSVAKTTLKDNAVVIGRIVDSVKDAKDASAEGANFILLKTSDGDVPDIEMIKESKRQQKGGSVPVIPYLPSLIDCNVEKLQKMMTNNTKDGITVQLIDIPDTCRAIGLIELPNQNYDFYSKFLLDNIINSKTVNKEVENKLIERPRRLLSESREKLIIEEKNLLERILDTLKIISPEIEEISLLEGASKQLDELFLVVVVGEYNSGKSSVVNALLGQKYLEEGILPTTNEISVLRFASPGISSNTKKTCDGYVERYLSAPLLREINIVDTPGTNVILERQQRLTEEYVPRADMVLFVMSCDRPFTESEVNFLKYIRKWGKKVVFVINKIDILSNEKEIEEMKTYVAENAKKLLNLDQAYVWPVSSRIAIEAKELCGNSQLGGLNLSIDDNKLKNNENWKESRFEILETFISDYFSGASGVASAESVRLKLQTPLYVADALLEASRKLLESKEEVAERDLNSTKDVFKQMKLFEEAVYKDSQIQRQAARKIIDKAVVRAESIIDETLQLSNLFSIRGKLIDSKNSKVSKGFGETALGTIVEDLKDLISQHSDWLIQNCKTQLKNYTEYATECAEQLGLSLDKITTQKSNLNYEKFKNNIINDYLLNETNSNSSFNIIKSNIKNELSMQNIIKKMMEEPGTGIDMCEEMMDSEVREALNATTGTAIAALGIGLVSTIILPEIQEDILAISLSLLIGYVALLNLPLKRGEIKSKIRRFGSNVYDEIDNILKSSTDTIIKNMDNKIASMIEPLEIIFERQLDKIIEYQGERLTVENELEMVKKEVANIE